MKNKILCILFTFACMSGFAGAASAQMESGNYSMAGSVLSTGGEPVASDNYGINATLGQPSPLSQLVEGYTNLPSSENYHHYPGFWFASGAYREPTLIQLSFFKAVPSSNEVIIEWLTESEIDNAGFNLYRTESEDGQYTKINTSLIPAQDTSTQGANYEFIDKNVQNRKTYYYKLEDIDTSGISTLHGPIKATPRLIFGIGK